jgi:predicted XRE-type DNA-binding protein
MPRTNKVTRSSGNVFADIGLPNASEHELKARIVLTLSRTIEALELSQTEAARRIGIGQPDLSKILHGNFSGFSLVRLLNAVTKLGSGTWRSKSKRAKTMPRATCAW